MCTARDHAAARAHLPIQPGFITIRNTATSGVNVAIVPHDVHALESFLYSASFHEPASPARAFASSFFCSGATKPPKQMPEMPNRISDQRIHLVPSSGRCACMAIHTPVTMMANTPGTVNRRSLLTMPSRACALARRSPVMSACTFQNTPVMMLPRNSTTLITCRDLRIRYSMSVGLALEPRRQSRRVELEVLVQNRIDGVDVHLAAVIAQAGMRPVAQLEAHARDVEAGAARNAHVIVDGFIHVIGQSCALLHFTVVREINPTRPELHEPNDGSLELTGIELRGRGGGHDPGPLRRVEFAIRQPEGIAGEDAGRAVIDDGQVMQGVPGCVHALEDAPGQLEPLPVLRDGDPLARNRQDFTVQA